MKYLITRLALTSAILLGPLAEVAAVEQDVTACSTCYGAVIERFLKESVPGLKGTSYRMVIDAMINEGFDVYIQGGLIRDLLDGDNRTPHDVDLFYTGNTNQMRRLLERKQWTHTTLPGKNLVSIGDASGIFIDATPASFGIHEEVSEMEYTLNNIVYHCNTKEFMPGSEEGFKDLRYRRLRVLTNNWYNWIHEPGGVNFKKIFRFWKMVGKGFIYSQDFEQFIVRQTLEIQLENRSQFHDKLYSYLSKNLDSLDEIIGGCETIMGREWCKKNILEKRDLIDRKEIAFKDKQVWHTYSGELGQPKESPLKLALRSVLDFFAP